FSVDDPNPAMVILSLYAIYSFFFSQLYAMPKSGYITFASLSILSVYVLDQFNIWYRYQENGWFGIMAGIAATCFLAGMALDKHKPAGRWPLTMRRSGLALGMLLNIMPMFESGLTATIIILVNAVFFGWECFKSRSQFTGIIAHVVFWYGYLTTFGRLENEILVLAIYTVFTGWYAQLFKEKIFRYITFASLALTAGHGLSYYGVAYSDTTWPILMTSLAGGYFLVGFFLEDYWKQSEWGVTARNSGLILSTFVSFATIARMEWEASITLAGTGVMFTIDTIWKKRNWSGFAANLFFLGAYFKSLEIVNRGEIIFFAAGILAYYMAGFIPVKFKRSGPWVTAIRTSGLVFGALLAVVALGQGGLQAVVSIALMASMFAIEGYFRRNVWLGFPANFLYLAAYFAALNDLKVIEPQFFTVGAALLGLVMHYLLMRSENPRGAFFTGMISQMILLSTSYLQMITTGRGVFFIILFLQALVVLGYGVVIRSRSLVITPIAFVVLAVVTILYDTLSDSLGATTVLIGGVGTALILFGIFASVLRERVAEAREKLEVGLSDWQA
ncbi:MAG: hypothetical protein OEZ02_06025, partial [Anaerolineae bacterium]|nr:hypothetical protein [Anaerolineae bacterium]